MDGTIIDSEHYWMAAERTLVESFGGVWTDEDGLALVGSSMWHSSRVIQAHGVDLPEMEIVDRLTEAVRLSILENVPWRPGARELLLALTEHSVPMALVTMSQRTLAELVVAAIEFPAFAAIVSGNDVTHGKPHPEPYLLGAELLGVMIADCVAIEDSEPGLASAVASGAVSIGVPHAVPLLEGSTHTLWDSLDGRTVDHIADVYSRGRAS
jgi:HAD superfamily hydrolase (TIGR01509 family)